MAVFFIASMLLSLTCFVMADQMSTSKEGCTPFQFHCKLENRCIPGNFRCNGLRDCVDNSDELGCGCAPFQFRCKQENRCIPGNLRCDDFQDCADNSDELGCALQSINNLPKCASFQFHCIMEDKCIPGNFRCDGYQDCASDESGCMCGAGEFQCLDGDGTTCVNDTRVCNIEMDCPHGEDELGCHNYCNKRNNKTLCYSTGRCISLDKRCDRERDCIDGSDEFFCPESTTSPPVRRYYNSMMVRNRILENRRVTAAAAFMLRELFNKRFTKINENE